MYRGLEFRLVALHKRRQTVSLALFASEETSFSAKLPYKDDNLTFSNKPQVKSNAKLPPRNVTQKLTEGLVNPCLHLNVLKRGALEFRSKYKD
jgi:hypothetical protein